MNRRRFPTEFDSIFGFPPDPITNQELEDRRTARFRDFFEPEPAQEIQGGIKIEYTYTIPPTWPRDETNPDDYALALLKDALHSHLAQGEAPEGQEQIEICDGQPWLVQVRLRKEPYPEPYYSRDHFGTRYMARMTLKRLDNAHIFFPPSYYRLVWRSYLANLYNRYLSDPVKTLKAIGSRIEIAMFGRNL